jgi:hypothetical protein
MKDKTEASIRKVKEESDASRPRNAYARWESVLKDADDDLALGLFVRDEFSTFCMSQGYVDRAADLDEEIGVLLLDGECENLGVDEDQKEVLRERVLIRKERRNTLSQAEPNIPSAHSAGQAQSP